MFVFLISLRLGLGFFHNDAVVYICPSLSLSILLLLEASVHDGMTFIVYSSFLGRSVWTGDMHSAGFWRLVKS